MSKFFKNRRFSEHRSKAAPKESFHVTSLTIIIRISKLVSKSEFFLINEIKI